MIIFAKRLKSKNYNKFFGFEHVSHFGIFIFNMNPNLPYLSQNIHNFPDFIQFLFLFVKNMLILAIKLGIR